MAGKKSNKKPTLIYEEDSWRAEVELVTDDSDSEWERKKLKVVRTLRHSPIFCTPPDGNVFDVEKRKGYDGFPGLWELKEVMPNGSQEEG